MHITDSISVNGQQIPIFLDASGQESLVVLITHGFGGSRNSSSGEKAAHRFIECGIGSIRFDLPGHGDNRLPLSLSNCLDTIAAVETFLHQTAPQAEIAYFSSSFGGYLNLLYCTTRPHLGHRSLLRCAAVNMPTLLHSSLSQLDRDRLNLTGSTKFALDDTSTVQLTQHFLEELDHQDLFSRFSPAPTDRFHMIHGVMDRVVPFSAIQDFSRKFRLPLTSLPNAGHQFDNPGEMDQLLDLTISFFFK
ncbi:MAG: alpha/beta hydrolase [Oscillospiraceae bacterium]|jgi:alpha/beta superfamily hydrolase